MWMLEIESLSEKRYYFIDIILMTSFLKSGLQCRSKIIERARSIRMGWREEFESLTKKRNCIIEIILLTSLSKTGQQCICKIIE